MRHEIRHFAPHEFRCLCCGRVEAAAALVFWLDVLRRSIGLPVAVNSGFRCAARNEAVGGSASSRHLIGCAADLARPAAIDYRVFVDVARRLSGPGWEIVTYDSQTYFHLAVPRDCQAKLWDGRRVLAFDIF